MRKIDPFIVKYLEPYVKQGYIFEQDETPAQKLADIACLFEGVREEGGDNKGRFVEAFQKTVDAKSVSEPWCMCFVQTCIGYIENVLGLKSDLKATESVKNFLPNEIPKYFPSVGDVVAWVSYNGTGHCGIVVKLHEDGSFDSIEGNTSNPQGFDRDGNGVYLKKRSIKDMGKYKFAGFVKVF